MSLVLPIQIILSITFLQALRITSLPEEAFLGYPMQNDEEYLYLDNRADPAYIAANAIKQSETRRRSILDKNFARFGRSGNINSPKSKMMLNSDPEMKNMMYLNDDDLDPEPFGRNARSGERSDQFIRFGRGKSDFVRFGRADGGYQRNRDFIRFGRSTRSLKNLKDNAQHAPNANEASRVGKMAVGHKMAENRKKRSANLDFYKKGGSNFVRFGRDRNENFMRFGRMMNENYMPDNQNTNLNGGLANPASASSSGGASLDNGPNVGKSYNNTSSLKKYLEELHGQQGHELMLRMLVGLLTKSHQLQKILQDTTEKNQQNVKQDIHRCT